MPSEILTAARPCRLPARSAEPPYDDERPGSVDGVLVAAPAPAPVAGPAPTSVQAPLRDAVHGLARRRVPEVPDGPPDARDGDGRAQGAGEASDVRLIPAQRGSEPQPRHPSRRTAATDAVTRAHPVARAQPGGDGRFQPTPSSAAAVVVRAIVEALSGIRPATQLACWTTPRLQADLERRIPRETRRGRWAIRSIRVSEPRPGVAEVSAVIIRSTRAAAVALRMESADGRWRVTTLQVG